MAETPRKLPVIFYRTTAGVEPVRDWLRKLSAADCNIIGQDLMRLQFRWPVGMPLCRPLGSGLWEVRSNQERFPAKWSRFASRKRVKTKK